jgi:hypothetical protein
MKSRNISLNRYFYGFFCVCVFFQISFFTLTSFGAEQNAESEQVEFFTAISNGQIDVTLTQSDSLNGRITIKNKTKKNLLLQLPSTFAGVPYNAQAGDGTLPADTPAPRPSGGSSSSSSTSTNNTNNQNQSIGGGMGGYGGGMGGYGGGMGGYGGGYGGGWQSLPPEKIVRHNVKTVCLEYGKKEPRNNIKYHIKPLDSISDKPEVGVLCSMIASGTVDQWSAQAAVWHHNNNMSWDEIASKRVKPRIDSMYKVPLFSPQQISYAINLSRQVEATVAKENLKPKKLKSKNQVFKPAENYDSLVNE